MPFGGVLAVLAILIWIAALTRLHTGEALMIGGTALVASANWWWAKKNEISEAAAADAK